MPAIKPLLMTFVVTIVSVIVYKKFIGGKFGTPVL